MVGNRPIDVEQDWLPHVGRYHFLQEQAREYWQAMKEREVDADEVQVADEVVAGLSPHQRLLYDTFVGHYQQVLDGQAPPQLLVQVDGKGGTGKSHALLCTSDRLEQMARENGHRCPVARVAPTGVAANNIRGSTLHSLLSLPVNSSMNVLDQAALGRLQARLQDYHYYIIDEKSMIGLRQLSFIDQRFRQAYPQDHNKPFGGRNIMLIGDFFQLPPVGERPLYTSVDTRRLKAAEIHGRNLYQEFDKTIELSVVHRQQGPEQAAFRDALEGLRNNNPTRAHWELLASRVQARLTPEEVDSFRDALRIYPFNAQVKDYNNDHLERLGRPCLSVQASHTGFGAEKVDSSLAGNLHRLVPLIVGSRVMLTENTWTGAGLVNGAMGTVYDFAWEPMADPAASSPFVVLVRFDNYSGPQCFTPEDLGGDPARIVPIFQSTRTYMNGSAVCTRTQFPLTTAYAITVHKSQGCTLDKAVLDVSSRDFSAGLSYVAVSRVRSLDGIMFDCNFDLEALRNESGGAQDRIADMIRRIPQQLHPRQGEGEGQQDQGQPGPIQPGAHGAEPGDAA